MIPHNKPTLGKQEELAAKRIIQSGWLAEGTEVEKFENNFCDFIGISHGHAVAVSSGTSALYLALWVLNAKKKKVTFPSYVCASLRYAVNMAQAKEEIIDIENDNPNISINELNNSDCSIAIVPHICMYALQNQNVKRNIAKKVDIRMLQKEYDGENRENRENGENGENGENMENRENRENRENGENDKKDYHNSEENANTSSNNVTNISDLPIYTNTNSNVQLEVAKEIETYANSCNELPLNSSI